MAAKAKKKTAKKKAGKKKTAKKTGGKKVVAQPTRKQQQEVIDKFRVQLQTGVPIPEGKNVKGKYDDLLPSFRDMEPGDTFFIPDGWQGIENAGTFAGSQCSRWNSHFKGERKYIQRRLTEKVNGVPVHGARIWRAE